MCRSRAANALCMPPSCPGANKPGTRAMPSCSSCWASCLARSVGMGSPLTDVSARIGASPVRLIQFQEVAEPAGAGEALDDESAALLPEAAAEVPVVVEPPDESGQGARVARWE